VNEVSITPRPSGPASLHDAWQALADRLMIQRLHLHLAEWGQLVADAANLPNIVGADVAAFTSRPATVPSSGAVRVLEGAGLTYWWRLAY
jgi:hypothetical protein